MASWNTPAQVRALWADADALDDTTLQLLLNSAHRDCFRYLDPIDGLDPLDPLAVTPADDDTVASLQLAEIYQARARFNAVRSAGDGNQIGADGMTVTVFPLDWQVQQLLRPKHGRITIA
jgi:hypothetical protein